MSSLVRTLWISRNATTFGSVFTPLLLGLVFVRSGTSHLVNPYQLLESVYSYDIVSPKVGEVIAIYLPLLEIVLSACLLLRLHLTGALMTSACLFVFFAAAQLAVVADPREIECGCNLFPGQSAGIQTLLLDFVLLAATAHSYLIILGCYSNVGLPDKEGRSLEILPAEISSTRGFALVELLVAVAIIGTLASLILITVQGTREQQRELECGNRLRQVSIGALQFEAANRFLPPGTTGVATAFPFADFDNVERATYWKRYQYTSSLGLILPFVELKALSAECDPCLFEVHKPLWPDTGGPMGQQRFAWFGEIPGYAWLSQQRVSEFECPSDTVSNDGVTGVMGVIQPVLAADGSDGIAWMELLGLHMLNYARSNYAGCAGAVSGGEYASQSLNQFRGMMSSGRKRRLGDILDGTSQTIMYGESLGTIRSGNRVHRMSWLTGGLARGRPYGWHVTQVPGAAFLGDANEAMFLNFASAHHSGVYFAFGDGHVSVVSRDTDWRLYYSACGICDGGAITVIPGER